MASARILRGAAEGSRLPKLCICCGEPAAQFVQHSFRWQPGWWLLLSVPLIGLLIIGVMALLAYWGVPRLIRRVVLLAMFACLLPVGEGNGLAVPVCFAHRYRLKWHEFYLWLLLLVLVPVAAVGLYAAVSHDVQTSESILFGCLLSAPLLLAGSIAIRFFTPRLTAAEGGHIDLAMLSSEFVRALAHREANMHTLVSQPTGRPLPSGLAAIPRWAFIVGGGAAALMVLTILSCGGLFVLVTWYQHQRLREMVARSEARANVRIRPPAIPQARSVPPAFPGRDLAPPSPRSPLPPPPPAVPAATADQAEPPASPKLERAAPGGAGRGRRPTRATPGFEMQSTQEVQVDDLLHVWTGEIWRMGMATEVAEGQVRVRLMGARPTPGEWYALDEVRHTRPPAMRAALAKSGARPPASPNTVSTGSLATIPPATSSPKPASPSMPPTAAPPDPAPLPTGSSTPTKGLLEKSGKLRTWTDASGKFRIEAELVKVEDEQAVLRKADGSIVRIPLSKLSLEDRLQAIAESP